MVATACTESQLVDAAGCNGSDRQTQEGGSRRNFDVVAKLKILYEHRCLT